MPVARIFCRISTKQIQLHIGCFCDIFCFFKIAVRHGLELQFVEDFPQFRLVGFLHLQFVEIQLDGHIGFDGGEEFGEADLLLVRLHLGLHRALQFAAPF